MAVYGLLVVWAHRPGHADRWAALVAATGMGLVVATANLGAQAIGWWGGHWSYALPVPLQVSFWLLWITPPATLLLGGYRWLLAHAGRPRRVYGLLGLLVLAPFIVVADTWALSTGRLSMGGGYAIWHDVLVGQVFFWLPVLLYETARRQWRATPGESVRSDLRRPCTDALVSRTAPAGCQCPRTARARRDLCRLPVWLAIMG